MISHGLTQGGETCYIKNMCEAFSKAGFQTIVMVRRGIGTNKLKTHRFL